MGRPKKATTASSGRGQNTLFFAQKITKSSAPTNRLHKSVDQKPGRQSSVAEVKADSPTSTLKENEAGATSPTDRKLALRQQPPAAPAEPAEAPRHLRPEEEEALHLTDARIKKYWKAKEDDRLHPRGKRASLRHPFCSSPRSWF